MKTDKQLLALTKTELLEEYRELETKYNELKASYLELDIDVSLNEAIKIVRDNGLIVKSKNSYQF